MFLYSRHTYIWKKTFRATFSNALAPTELKNVSKQLISDRYLHFFMFISWAHLGTLHLWHHVVMEVEAQKKIWKLKMDQR